MKYIKTYEELEDKLQIEELYLNDKELTELPDLNEYTNLKLLKQVFSLFLWFFFN